MDLKKAKIDKEKALDISYIKPDAVNKPVPTNETHTSPMHEDLIAAWRRLDKHLAIMVGYVKTKEPDINAVDGTLFEGFTARAFSIGGGDDKNDGVVISGHVKLPNGKAVILNTPFTRFEEKPETRYQYMDDLVWCLDKLKAEIIAYVKGDKMGKNPQGNLFDQQPEEAPKTEKVTKIQFAPEEGQLAGGTGQFVQGNGAPKKTRKKVSENADPEAMARVAAASNDELNGKTGEQPEPAKKERTGRKRVPQSPDAPGGIVE